MRKDVQAALESAIAVFEKWRQAEQERLRERERFEADWALIRTAVVVPALEEVAELLEKAGWEYQLRRKRSTGPFHVLSAGELRLWQRPRTLHHLRTRKAKKRYIGQINNERIICCPRGELCLRQNY